MAIIPHHRHEVSLTMTRSELEGTYGLRPGLAMSLRLPYDVKEQRVEYTTLGGGPFVPPYGDIHHRTETLRGFADGTLLVLWSPSRTGASHWRIGVGTTLPVGDTVADPIELGRKGIRHQHLQFGNGVFAPAVEAGWSRPFARTLVVSGMVQATLPLTTNGEGFRSPRSLRWSVGPTFTAGRYGVGLSAAGQVQTIGRWHGETDEGTGFANGGLRLQVNVPIGPRVSIAPSVYRELYSQGFNDERFSQGTTFGFTIRRFFPN